MTTMHASPGLASKAKYLSNFENKWWDLDGTSGALNDVAVHPDLAQALRASVTSLGNCYATVYLGTGANQNMQMALQLLASKRTLLPCAPAVTIRSPAEAVAFVRKTFDLNVKQLSEVLKVERVTVYDWLRKDSWGTLHPGRQTRLMDVAAVATLWAQRDPLPPGYLVEPLDASGETVLKLLSQDNIQRDEVLAAYGQLVHNKPLNQRAREFAANRGAATREALSGAMAKVRNFGIE